MSFSLRSLLSLATSYKKPYMAKLGPFQFSIETAAFDTLQHNASYKWQGKERIGRTPAQQFTGPEAETITLGGAIYPHYKGGIKQIGLMRALAKTGQPQPLIYAFERVGQYCGKWCITSVDETRTVFFDDGSPRKIEFNLTLVEYGEDGPPLASAKGAAPGVLAGVIGALASVVGLATRTGATSGAIASSLSSQLAVIASYSGVMGQNYGPVSSSMSNSINVAEGVKASSHESLAVAGGTPNAGRIAAAAEMLTANTGRDVAVTSQSSATLNAAYASQPEGSPPELMAAMRGAQVNVGGLAKLVADTAVSANALKGTL